MTFNGILQIGFFFLLVLAVTKPMGIYLKNVYEDGGGPLARVFGPIERLFYKLLRVDPSTEMNWKQYGFAMLLFSVVSTVGLYLVQRLQGGLPLNPQNFAGVSEASSFNTAISFVTNTNWQ